MIELSDITQFAAQLEGPYKWYILGAVLVVLTAVVTRFIFHTIKWFFVLVALALILLAALKIFSGVI
jgi:hypothetical protein